MHTSVVFSHLAFNVATHGYLHKIVFLLAAVLFYLLSAGTTALAETGPHLLKEKVAKSIEIRQKTQKKEDKWAGEKAELMARYRSLKVNLGHLETVRLRTETALSVLKDRVAGFERKARESARISKELQSYLESVATQLGEFIRRDLPFLAQERADRVASIKEILARPDKPGAEKYRIIMEALQIETEYGRTVEVYQDTIDLDGRSVLLDVLRFGRLSLFCQTPDSKIVGHYDRAAGIWVLLPSKYRRQINRAVEMARRQRTIDLVKLPIGRIRVP
ncbi:MAG: DUF3450 domain-containing protein [Proteobacteria bacterium]|nr:DUF3450 domain-containing protein [Pseudomonadota bacterium]